MKIRNLWRKWTRKSIPSAFATVHATDADVTFYDGPGMHTVKAAKQAYNITWIALLKHGFVLVKTWLLTACGSGFYAIIARTSCNKACIFPNSADFKDRIFDLPRCFCSLYELVAAHIRFSLVVVWQQSFAFKFVKIYRTFRTHPSFLCCHTKCSFD